MAESNTPTKLITLNNLDAYKDHIEEKNIQLTRSQYTALPSTKLTNGKSYFITDEGIVIKNGISYGNGAGEINVQSDWSVTDSTSDAYIKNKPTKVSDFSNDSGFITKAVNDLINYYTTSNTYTKTEVDNLISAAKNGRFELVSTLPSSNIKTNVIYLVPKSISEPEDIKDEYINLDGTVDSWEKIGSTDIDLSDYYTSSEVDDLLDDLEDTLQANFQDGVDDVYDAVVAKGSTPASHSLADVVIGIGAIPNYNNGTYTATTRDVGIDMGVSNTYRYVSTNDVPNINSGTYSIDSNGIKDMGATNDNRYIDASVQNSNSGTYTFPANDTGDTKDMGATNDNRYTVATNVYDKGFSDGKADHSTTYSPTSRASNNDMGQTHSYRYVDTTNVPNSNSGTYDVTSNGTKDMGAANTYRYTNVSVPNSNSGTYTFAENDTGGIKDMGASNDKRYVVATNVYNKGKADGKADHSTTYKPTSRASNNDMGQTHSYRYVNTTSVPNSNTGTYDVTSNGIKDMGATNNKRYVNVNVSNSNSGTYTFAENDTGGTKDMGADNSYRYVNATNVYNKGKADGKADHSTTYKPTTRASNLDMGQTHSYRYVNTTSVPNSNSGTYATVTTNGTHDMGSTNSYRYVTVNVPHPTHTGTYTPTSRASNCDMGSTHTYRYVNTNSVPNSKSGTYTKQTTNGVKDMTATNTNRYVNVAVPNSNSGTTSAYTSNGIKDMGASNTYRYVNVNVPFGTFSPSAGTNIYMYASIINCANTRKIAPLNMSSGGTNVMFTVTNCNSSVDQATLNSINLVDTSSTTGYVITLLGTDPDGLYSKTWLIKNPKKAYTQSLQFQNLPTNNFVTEWYISDGAS